MAFVALLLLAASFAGAQDVPDEARAAAALAARPDMAHLAARVTADKAATRAAAAAPDAAFDAFVATHWGHAGALGAPGSAQDDKTVAQRRAIFADNLRRAEALNAAPGSELVAHGITPFMHLTREEFASRVLNSGLLSSVHARGLGAHGPAPGRMVEVPPSAVAITGVEAIEAAVPAAAEAGGSARRLLQAASPSPKLASPSPKLASPSPKLASPSPKLASPSPKLASPSPKLASPSPKLASPSPKLASPSPKLASPSPKLASPSPKLPSPSPKLPSPSPKLPSPSPKLPSPSPKLPSPSPKLPSPSPVAPSPSPKLPSPSPAAAPSPSPKLPSPSPKLASPSPKLPSPSPRPLASPSPSPANPLLITSNGAVDRPFCVFFSTCPANWQAACADQICQLAGFAGGSFVSASQDLCTGAVSGPTGPVYAVTPEQPGWWYSFSSLAGTHYSAVTAQCTCSGWRPYPYASAPVPTDVNWVAAGRVTPVRDQSGCGSCAAFSSGAALESGLIQKYGALGYTNTTTDLAEQDLLDCVPGDGCQGEAPETYMGRAACDGVGLETADPYVSGASGVDTDACRAGITRVSGNSYAGGGGFAYVPLGASPSDSLAQALGQAPVVILVDANDEWMTYKSGVLGGASCATNSTGINHAVTVVGAFSAVTLPNGAKADLWLAKNSWNTWWGSNNPGFAGFLWLRKGCTAPGPFNMHLYEPVMALTG